MGRVVGTPKAICIDGIDYDLFSDTAIEKVSSVVNEVLSTTGGGIVKQIIQTPARNGIKIVVPTVKEWQNLEYAAEKGEDIQMHIKYRNNDIERYFGSFNIQNGSSEDGSATIDILTMEPIAYQAS